MEGPAGIFIASFETTDFCKKKKSEDNPCCLPDGPGLNGTPCLDGDGVIRIDDNAPVISEIYHGSR